VGEEERREISNDTYKNSGLLSHPETKNRESSPRPPQRYHHPMLILAMSRNYDGEDIGGDHIVKLFKRWPQSDRFDRGRWSFGVGTTCFFFYTDPKKKMMMYSAYREQGKDKEKRATNYIADRPRREESPPGRRRRPTANKKKNSTFGNFFSV
jgi:hypothetical protein